MYVIIAFQSAVRVIYHITSCAYLQHLLSINIFSKFIVIMMIFMIIILYALSCFAPLVLLNFYLKIWHIYMTASICINLYVAVTLLIVRSDCLLVSFLYYCTMHSYMHILIPLLDHRSLYSIVKWSVTGFSCWASTFF